MPVGVGREKNIYENVGPGEEKREGNNKRVQEAGQ